MKAAASRPSAAPRAAVESRHLELQILMVVLIALIAATLLVNLGMVEGTPAQTGWQELGPASTAN